MNRTHQQRRMHTMHTSNYMIRYTNSASISLADTMGCQKVILHHHVLYYDPGIDWRRPGLTRRPSGGGKCCGIHLPVTSLHTTAAIAVPLGFLLGAIRDTDPSATCPVFAETPIACSHFQMGHLCTSAPPVPRIGSAFIAQHYGVDSRLS